MRLIHLTTLFIVCVYPMVAHADAFSSWNGLLKDDVHTGNKHGVELHLVDYQALEHDPRWQQTLTALKQADLSTLSSKQEKLAFWINAYNILAVKMVVDHKGIKSIKDVGSWYAPVWNHDAGIVAGSMKSLNDIENNVLRPMGDPRIHFAIVCASVSCPDLRQEAYQAANLNAQLNEQAASFLSNTAKGARFNHGQLQLSSIFKWFADDFQHVGGVIAFIQQHSSIKAQKIDAYLDYDWSLNGK